MEVEERGLQGVFRGEERGCARGAGGSGDAEEGNNVGEEEQQEGEQAVNCESDVDDATKGDVQMGTEMDAQDTAETETEIGVDVRMRCGEDLRGARDKQRMEESDATKTQIRNRNGEEDMDRLMRCLMYPARYDEIGDELMEEQGGCVIDVALNVLEEARAHRDEW